MRVNREQARPELVRDSDTSLLRRDPTIAVHRARRGRVAQDSPPRNCSASRDSLLLRGTLCFSDARTFDRRDVESLLTMARLAMSNAACGGFPPKRSSTRFRFIARWRVSASSSTSSPIRPDEIGRIGCERPVSRSPATARAAPRFPRADDGHRRHLLPLYTLPGRKLSARRSVPRSR